MGSSVNSCESLLLQAQSRLERAKDAKKQAQANGSYKNASKSTLTRVADGRALNNFDYEIYKAQEEVKRCKANLAEAKKSAKKK